MTPGVKAIYTQEGEPNCSLGSALKFGDLFFKTVSVDSLPADQLSALFLSGNLHSTVSVILLPVFLNCVCVSQ